MEEVDSAEKEASEVLHSLLSVERVEKTDKVSSGNPRGSFTSTTENDQEVQWTTTPVTIGQSFLTEIETNGPYPQSFEDHEVIWESHTIHLASNELPVIEQRTNSAEDVKEEEDEVELTIIDERKIRPKVPIRRPKVKAAIKRKKKKSEDNDDEEDTLRANDLDPTKLETSAAQVKERFKRGCECQDESCFFGLNPEVVYKHRLNIAELTKGEHDMYLMGVTMACLANPDTTVRQKERRRLRAQYVYQGRRVCLDAFLYLENCTHYQLKRIRKHVMTHGVAPRVHGNHGKKPHNTFSLDIYRHATEFLKQYIEQHTGAVGICSSKQPIQLPWDITRKNLHDAYKEYGQILEPGIKLMGYSTFRHFMKEQFPHLKFCKIEPKPQTAPTAAPQPSQPTNRSPIPIRPALAPSGPAATNPVQVVTTSNSITPQVTLQNIQTIKQAIQPVSVGVEAPNIQIQKCIQIQSNEVQQVIPLVVAPNDAGGAQPHTFIVTPVQQIISNGGLAQANASANTFSYQIANGYVINEQGNIVTALPNGQHTPFTFSRI